MLGGSGMELIGVFWFDVVSLVLLFGTLLFWCLYFVM